MDVINAVDVISAVEMATDTTGLFFPQGMVFLQLMRTVPIVRVGLFRVEVDVDADYRCSPAEVRMGTVHLLGTISLGKFRHIPQIHVFNVAEMRRKTMEYHPIVLDTAFLP